jgi:hypothetical protein
VFSELGTLVFVDAAPLVAQQFSHFQKCYATWWAVSNSLAVPPRT